MSSEIIEGKPELTTDAAATTKTGAGGGMLVVVSSPSGGGKGTLVKRVRETVPDVGYSVSWTTRTPRAGETDGRDYHFTTRELFAQMQARGDFLESAEVHGNLYGTAWSELTETRTGHDIILELDVQGAKSVRERVQAAIGVFILPPSFEVLRLRLTARASEKPEDLALRLRNSRGEVEHYRDFDYVILNDEIERASAQLASIIVAERARRERQEQVAQRVLQTFT